MKKSTLSMLLALAPLVIQPACAPDDAQTEEADETGRTGTAASALLGGSKLLWPMQDGKATIRVCWLPLDTSGMPLPGGTFAIDATKTIAERKQWVREGVEREWNGKTVLNFVGWEDCGAAEVDIKIQPIGGTGKAQCGVGPDAVVTGGYCVESIGTPDKGKRVFINVTFGDDAIGQGRYLQSVTPRTVNPATAGTVYRPAICGPQIDAAFLHFQNNQPITAADIDGIMPVYKDCLQNVSNHEFGHLAGFSHEQNRRDVTAACAAQYPASTPDDPSNEDSPLGTFELDSIMSYCRVTLPGTLTNEDIQQTNAFYEKFATKLPSAKTTTKSDPGADPSSGAPSDPSSEADPAAAAPKKKKSASVSAPEKGGCNGN